MGIGLVEKYDDVVFINFVEFKKVEINRNNLCMVKFRF